MKLAADIGYKLRIVGLMVTLGCTLFTIGKLAIEPPKEKQQAIAFPAAVIPLSGWDYRGSDRLQDPDGKVYRYGGGDRLLEIEMRQINHTDGNIDKYLQTYKDIQPLLMVKQQSEIGFYGLFIDSGNAYLSSCINPRGENTVTAEQFTRNRNTYDLQWNRVLSWLLGISNLREWDCLWVNLSIPLDDYSQEHTYLKLEKAWFESYDFWVSIFRS